MIESEALIVGAPNMVYPRPRAAGSAYVAVPGSRAAEVLAQSFAPPAIGSIAAPTAGSPGTDSIVWAPVELHRSSPRASWANVAAWNGPDEGAVRGQVWVIAVTPWRGGCRLPRTQ